MKLLQFWVGPRYVIDISRIVSSNQIHTTGKKYLDSPEEGLAELSLVYNNDDKLSGTDLSYITIWAAYFSDTEFAMEAAEKAVRSYGTNADRFWFPVMKEVRQLPRFKEFVREIGLVDYWNQFGWPDLCRPVGNDDFVCD